MMPIAQPKPIFEGVAEWPTQPAAASPAMGHNKPPLEEVIPEEFMAELLRERPDFLTKLDLLVDAAGRAKATNDDELGRCGDLVDGYRKLANHINATHKTVKEPYLQGGRLVDAEKNALMERITSAKASVEAIGNAYVADRDARRRADEARIAAEQRAAAEAAARAERERAAAEEEAMRAQREAASAEEREAAAQRAAEAARVAEETMAAAALAPAAPAKVEPVRSDAGSTVSGKQEWKSEVTDYTVAVIEVLDNPKVREAIDKAIAGLVRAGKREIAGCRIYPVAKANFR